MSSLEDAFRDEGDDLPITEVTEVVLGGQATGVDEWMRFVLSS